MTHTTSARELLDSLANLLVKRFRSTQTLLRWTRQEQTALMNGDAPRLLALAEHKEVALDRLAALESAFEAQIGALTKAAAGRPGLLPMDQLAEIDPIAAGSLVRLIDGTETLVDQIRDLARANRALAQSALYRAAGMQAGWAFATQASLPALCAAILDARQALDAQDHAGVEAAVGDLQEALIPLDEAGAPIHPAVEFNLVEKMAGLYRQEKAYRAVVRVSSRVLTGG